MREGLRYVAGEPRLAVPLVMMAIVGTLAYEFQVTLPVASRQLFHGGAAVYGFMTAAMGIGAVIGGLFTATKGRTGLRTLSLASLGFGSAILLAALSPLLVVELAMLALVGWASVSFLATGNSTLQLNAAPSMRGRVMALWAVAFLGSTPIGGPAIGALVGAAGARVGLATGAVACFLAAGIGMVAMRRIAARAASPATVEGIEGSDDRALVVGRLPAETQACRSGLGA
jgi:MFS family permease